MPRNITLLKFILPLSQAWFWQGIWILFYLKFTNYAGIGLIESSMFIVGFFIEIPTGAFSDMVGKKITLVLSFWCMFLGELIMAFSQNFNHLLLSVFLIVVATALYSGTAEAIVYDSLKQTNNEKEYGKTLARIQTYTFIVIATCSVIGGFLYSIKPGLPFIANGIAALLALFLCLFLKEPPIDSEKFSIKNYLKQNTQGFKQLFRFHHDKNLLVQLLLICSFAFMLDQVLDGSLAIYFGFNEKELGVLFAALFVIGAIGSHVYPKLKKHVNESSLILIVAFVLLFSTAASPYIGIITGAIFLSLRHLLYPILNIASSDSINENVESKYRATSISTFVMMKDLPYCLIAIFIGGAIDTYDAGYIAMVLSIIFIAIYGITILQRKFN